MTEDFGGEPLTPAEQGLWLLQRLVPDVGITNVAVRWELPEPPRWWPLREALRWLVRRHPALRSCFPMRAVAPVRVVRPAGEVEDAVDLDVVDVTPDTVESALREFAGRPFDLERPPLARLGLFQAGAQHCLCLATHHLIIDAGSFDLLLNEFQAGYESISRTGAPPQLPAAAPVPPRPPRDRSREFWRRRLAGFDPAGNRLAADPTSAASGAPGAAPTFAGDEITRSYPKDLTEAVAALRSRCRSTDAAVLLSAYTLALRAEGAADDLVVGAMVDTRERGGPPSIGYRVATVPLRVTIAPEGTFADLAAAVGADLLDAVEHADVSFEELAAEFTAGDDPLWWRHGLLRHAFNHHQPKPDRQDWARRTRDVPTMSARFDLDLTVEPATESVNLRLVYSTEVHDREFAETLLDRMAMVIRQAHADPQRPVGDLDLRTEAEIALLDAVNDTAVRWEGPPTVPQLIAAAAQAQPDAVAILDGERQVRYRDLTGAAAAVARLLRTHGVRPGDLVAVAGPRSAALATAVLGVWLAGAAYLPLDTDHPDERLRYELDDAGCRIVLDGHLLPESVRAGRDCLPVPRNAPREVSDERASVESGDLAYVIYTSGSTGLPKGVRLTHGNLANLVRHFAQLLQAEKRPAMLWLTTFAFDISALELCLPLVTGGRVVVAPDEVRATPERLLALVERAGVTVVQATPTTWRLVAPAAGDRLTGCDLLCGGEPLPPTLAQQLLTAGRRAFNVYGPTETTIWSTVAELTAEEVNQVSVGRPIANTRVFVLDSRGRAVPPGITGELCLAGAGLAQGYHGQPELTGQRFRFDACFGRYYRTGDLARLLPDGRIALLGRQDRQVKLRAHRIELAEVESTLAGHEEVQAAAVVLHGDPIADGYLVAYLVAEPRPGLAEEVWSYARSRLPTYSLPSRMQVVAELPQTPNGKVDLAALALREPPAALAPPAAAPTHDAFEEQLLQAWQDVLLRPALDTGANFFLSGGTSVMAVRLAEMATARCGVPVSMGMIFRAPTPQALAGLLRDATG